MQNNSYRLHFHAGSLSDHHIATLHVREHEMENFFLTESQYPAKMSVPSHSHENPSFYFILGGGMTEKSGTSCRERRRSVLVFNPAGEFHSNKIRDRGCHLFMIEMKSQWVETLRDYVRLPDLTSHFSSCSAIGLAQRAYAESRQLDSLSPLAIEGAALQLIAQITRYQERAESKKVPWLEKVRDILHERFAGRVAVNQLAREVAVHPVYLSNSFRQHYGCSVAQYIRQLRVEFCCTQLRSSHASLAQIATEAGFFDQSHFTRAFKQLIGTTPAAYRDLTSPTVRCKTFYSYKTTRTKSDLIPRQSD